MGLFRTDKEVRETNEKLKNGCNGCGVILVIIFFAAMYIMKWLNGS